MLRRWAALFVWSYLAWILLSWTRTAEQLAIGAGIAAVVALVCAPLGRVVEPWRLLSPLRALRVLRTTGFVARRVVAANLSLSKRIWAPSRPLRPGMVIVPTEMRTEGGLGGVGLLTSLIVDNQVVDVDAENHELQYHVVWNDSADPDANRARANGPLEARVKGLER